MSLKHLLAGMLAAAFFAALAQSQPAMDFGRVPQWYDPAAGILRLVSPLAPMPTLDESNAAFASWPVLVASSGTYTVPSGTRALSANVTTAGNISLTDAAGNVKTYALALGFQTIPYLPASFTASAVATFWGDK